MNETDYKSIQNRLIEVMATENMTQKEVAKAIGISEACVSRWANGNRRPNAGSIIKLAKLFHVSADYLLGLENDGRIG